METTYILNLAEILVLGVGAMWIAWRFRLPAIIILLAFGFMAGPIANQLDPDSLLGELLIPLVSIAVSIILFEGGLNLKISQLRHTAPVVRNLITIGTLVTWVVGSLGAYFILGIDFQISVLLGAILVVTGPTVIMPLLRYLKPVSRLDSIIKWEAVAVDPIGTVLAILVFQTFLVGFPEAATHIILNLLKTILLAGGLGFLGAAILILAFRYYWIPEYLHSAVTLTLVVAIFAISNWIQADSGLLTVTVMGIIMANQRSVNIRHIAEFKENLGILIISSLFILLAARLSISDFSGLGINSLILLGVLLFIARPLTVFICTLGSNLNWRERAFLAALAPRGIVAAAVASLFAIRLTELGFPEAEVIVPIAFVMIAGTVVIYGLSTPSIARWLKVATPDPQGVLLVGGFPWALSLAEVLHKEGIKVMMVDGTWSNISQARMRGLEALYANVLSEYALEELETSGLGYIIAATPDDEYNSLVITQFRDVFGRDKAFQVSPMDLNGHGRQTTSRYLRGRILFDSSVTYDYLNQSLASAGNIKVTKLTDTYDYDAFMDSRKDVSVPLFLITEKQRLLIFSKDSKPRPQPNQKLVTLTFNADSK